MEKIQSHRSAATELFRHAIDAADPARAIAAHMSAGLTTASSGGRLIIIAAGKAAIPMMRGALNQLGNATNIDALVVTNYENSASIEGVEVLLAGHPIPDQNGVIAANAIIERLKKAQENDRVIALISGGASALLPAPAEGISLEDKALVNQILMQSGFEITETNLVRQQLSRLKGGKLNALAAPATVTAYILSDVIGDDVRVIASGPTASAIGDRAKALELLCSDQVTLKCPETVLDHLRARAPEVEAFPAENHLIGSNGMSLSVAADQARALGWNVSIIDAALVGNVADAAHKVSAAILATPAGQQSCLLFGGETSVNVTGSGKGGRNQDMALRVAMTCAERRDAWVFLSGGTDGRDGPTDAAGGLVDAESVFRMGKHGVDPWEYLSNNDSYHALKASEDLLITGATGTNVADIQIALIP